MELISHHDEIKHQIHKSCIDLGCLTDEEFHGKDWRADVFAVYDNRKYAFEIQVSKQSLNRTLERQAKYLRDGIIGCWFFEKEPGRHQEERLDLPLFKVRESNGEILVSLKEREEMPLDKFINNFVKNEIRFCNKMVTTKKQIVEISFIRMDCWKCGAENHIYFASEGFYSACNAVLHKDEMLWSSNRKEYMPEIIDSVQNYMKTEKGKYLKLGKIEERYSDTVGHSYVSFGCSKCNSIFGDFYVHEAIIDSFYGDGVIDKIRCEIEMNIDLNMDLPHWCHPNNGVFCE